jgi:hypothetical protein
MQHPTLAAALAALLSVWASGKISAQGEPVLQLADQTTYSESFTPVPQRAPPFGSRAIVGLHLGRGNGRFQIDQIAVSLPLNTSEGRFCVRLSSADARYHSLNSYRQSNARDLLPRIETRSRFRAELSRRFSSDEIQVKVVETPTCSEDANGVLVPAIPPGAQNRDLLRVFVNAVGSRPSIVLLDRGDTVVSEGVCSSAPLASVVVYTDICEIPLTPRAISAGGRLRINLLGEGTQTYEIRMPEK